MSTDLALQAEKGEEKDEEKERNEGGGTPTYTVDLHGSFFHIKERGTRQLCSRNRRAYL